MTLTPNELLERFLQNQKANTQRRYHYALKDFQKTMKREPWESDYSHALDYLQILRARIGQFKTPYAPETIRNTYHALSSMTELLVSSGHASINPFKAAKKLYGKFGRKQKRPTKLIPFRLVSRIIEAAGDARYGVRDQAILAVLFGGGLRRSELAALNLQDLGVTPTGKLYLIVQDSKAGEAQERVLPDWAWVYYSELLQQRKKAGAGPNDPLFVTPYGRKNSPNHESGRMVSRTIYAIFKRALKKFGIDAGPHSARATFASRMSAQGKSDRQISQALGHGTERSVRAYDKVSNLVGANPAWDLEYC